MEQSFHKHTNCISDGNSGESLALDTEFFWNGDDGLENSIFWNQRLTLHSYSNSASFDLTTNLLTPQVLRKIADELEKAENEAKEKLSEIQKHF
jgi:hypothetical protein